MNNGYPYPQHQAPMSYQNMPYPAPYYAPPPMNAPVPMSRMAPQAQVAMPQQFAAPVEPVKLYNKDVKYRFTKTNGERAILLSNVELPHALDVRSPTLRFKRGEPNIRGEMAFRFTPDGNDHVVRVMNNEDPIHTLRLSPKLPKVKFFKNGGKKLLIKNLFKPNNLRLASDNKITWNLQPHPTLKHAYVLNFDPHGQVHNVELSLINNKGERQLIRRGKMKLAPKNKPVPPKPRVRPAPYPQAQPYPMAYPPPQAAYPMAYPMAYPPMPQYDPRMAPPPPQYNNQNQRTIRGRGF